MWSMMVSSNNSLSICFIIATTSYPITSYHIPSHPITSHCIAFGEYWSMCRRSGQGSSNVKSSRLNGGWWPLCIYWNVCMLPSPILCSWFGHFILAFCSINWNINRRSVVEESRYVNEGHNVQMYRRPHRFDNIMGVLYILWNRSILVKCRPRNFVEQYAEGQNRTRQDEDFVERWSVNTLITCQQQSFDFSMKTERHLLACKIYACFVSKFCSLCVSGKCVYIYGKLATNRTFIGLGFCNDSNNNSNRWVH